MKWAAVWVRLAILLGLFVLWVGIHWKKRSKIDDTFTSKHILFALFATFYMGTCFALWMVPTFVGVLAGAPMVYKGIHRLFSKRKAPEFPADDFFARTEMFDQEFPLTRKGGTDIWRMVIRREGVYLRVRKNASLNKLEEHAFSWGNIKAIDVFASTLPTKICIYHAEGKVSLSARLRKEQGALYMAAQSLRMYARHAYGAAHKRDLWTYAFPRMGWRIENPKPVERTAPAWEVGMAFLQTTRDKRDMEYTSPETWKKAGEAW